MFGFRIQSSQSLCSIHVQSPNSTLDLKTSPTEMRLNLVFSITRTHLCMDSDLRAPRASARTASTLPSSILDFKTSSTEIRLNLVYLISTRPRLCLDSYLRASKASVRAASKLPKSSPDLSTLSTEMWLTQRSGFTPDSVYLEQYLDFLCRHGSSKPRSLSFCTARTEVPSAL